MDIAVSHGPESQKDVIWQKIPSELGIEHRGRAHYVKVPILQGGIFRGQLLYGSSGADTNTLDTIDTNSLYTGNAAPHTNGLGGARLHAQDTTIA